jgi:hypothetical protein
MPRSHYIYMVLKDSPMGSTTEWVGTVKREMIIWLMKQDNLAPLRPGRYRNGPTGGAGWTPYRMEDLLDVEA